MCYDTGRITDQWGRWICQQMEQKQLITHIYKTLDAVCFIVSCEVEYKDIKVQK